MTSRSRLVRRLPVVRLFIFPYDSASIVMPFLYFYVVLAVVCLLTEPNLSLLCRYRPSKGVFASPAFACVFKVFPVWKRAKRIDEQTAKSSSCARFNLEERAESDKAGLFAWLACFGKGFLGLDEVSLLAPDAPAPWCRLTEIVLLIAFSKKLG